MPKYNDKQKGHSPTITEFTAYEGKTPLPQKRKCTSESTVSYDKDYKRNAQWNIIWKCPEARKSLVYV